ncbi:hypothetical protein, partial [Pseudomonas syringae]|uniref:hypothetical protein n=1 Tax=Pseudomonas syringae TaxID=317 RepID=UPI001F2EA628
VALSVRLAVGRFPQVLPNCSSAAADGGSSRRKQTLGSLPDRRIATSFSGVVEWLINFRHGICDVITKPCKGRGYNKSPV